jgi:hypothetical protein
MLATISVVTTHRDAAIGATGPVTATVVAVNGTVNYKAPSLDVDL